MVSQVSPSARARARCRRCSRQAAERRCSSASCCPSSRSRAWRKLWLWKKYGKQHAKNMGIWKKNSMSIRLSWNMLDINFKNIPIGSQLDIPRKHGLNMNSILCLFWGFYQFPSTVHWICSLGSWNAPDTWVGQAKPLSLHLHMQATYEDFKVAKPSNLEVI